MVIGIYYGFGKPANVNKFLQPFVTDANFLVGKECKINTKLRSFKCDSPVITSFVNVQVFR